MWSLNRLPSVRRNLLMGGLPNFLAVRADAGQATTAMAAARDPLQCDALQARRGPRLSCEPRKPPRSLRQGTRRSRHNPLPQETEGEPAQRSAEAPTQTAEKC